MSAQHQTAMSAGHCVPLFGLVLACAAVIGCAGTEYVALRERPNNPLAQPLKLLSRKGPQATDRTTQLLRRYDLQQEVRGNPYEMEAELRRVIDKEPTAEKIYALAELTYIAGRRAESRGRRGLALEMYGTSLSNAYTYLMDDQLAHQRNPYDPAFRRACDLYNGALERTLRILQREEHLKPQKRYAITINGRKYDLDVVIRGRWRAEEFAGVKFVSDYRVEGLKNHYRTYGLGVPLIGLREHPTQHSAFEPYYPPGLTFPVTALLRVVTQPGEPGRPARFVLELHDPLMNTDVDIAGRRVPMETDLSTPLAFFLNQPVFRKNNLATAGLLQPGHAKRIQGLYMMEPYDPDKIPVLMVHGLWSSPMTWMEMFNDLRGLPEIRDYYQFWFYLYPTGQPFWNSATQLREDLAQLRQAVDPESQITTLDQMVLIGHSMGGLVSKMQVISSRDDFWRIVSDQSFCQLDAPSPLRDSLERTLFFHPNPSVRRVVTIATPHRGSNFANNVTRWMGRKLITLPRKMIDTSTMLVRRNNDVMQDAELLTHHTSIDSLAPDSPVLAVVYKTESAPWVKHHNIVGLAPDDGIFGQVAEQSDGIVSYQSAHLENVASEIVVEADHVTAHRHPRSILEVRRILLEHLAELRESRPVQNASVVVPVPTFYAGQ